MEEVKRDMHDLKDYMDPSPYPEMTVTCPNRAYAQLLILDYAGAASELTAITQYLYHHFMEDEDPAIAIMLQKIAIVEMMHMEKLAEMIRLLGEDPRFEAGCPHAPWTSGNVQYGVCLRDRLHADLAGEYAAIYNYREHLQEICDPKVRQVLKRIILDEKVHVCLLKQAIECHSR